MLNKLLLFTLLINTISTPQQNADSIFFSLTGKSDKDIIIFLLEKSWDLRSNQPLTALQITKQALKLSIENKDLSSQAKSQNYLGVIYTNLGANEVALDLHKSALETSRHADDWEQTAYSYNNIGGIYGYKNELTLATDNIQQAIKIFEENKDKTGLAYCSMNIGRLYKNQDNFDKSLNYFERALVISNEIGKQDLKARILLEIANLHFQKGKYNKAKETFHELENYYGEINYLKGLADVWNGLGEVYFKEKKFRNALDYIEKARQLNIKISNSEGEITTLNNIALIYLAFDKESRGKEFLTQSRNKSLKSNNPNSIIDMYKTHYQFYKTTGNLKNAIRYNEKYHNLKDSIFTKEEIVKLGELESLLRIEKAEREKHLLEKELELERNQKVYFLIILILFAVIVAILTHRFYEKKKLSDQLKQINLVKDKFFNIISHDLREPFSSTLGSIDIIKDCYHDLNEEERHEMIATIQKSVQKDYDLLENLLLWARSQSDNIKFEPVELNLKEVIQKNIGLIERTIERKRIELQINCNEEVSILADEQMINSAFRNLIFNAVKFTENGGKVSINSEINNGSVNISFSDTGLGMEDYTLANLFKLDKKVVIRGTDGETGSGLGLILTKEFIERHNGTISVKSKLKEGSTFKVSLPK